MKNNVARRLLVAALLFTWGANPAVVLAADTHVDYSSGTHTINGASNITHVGSGAVVNVSGNGTAVTLGGIFSGNQSYAPTSGGGVAYANKGASVIVESASQFLNNSTDFVGGAITIAASDNTSLQIGTNVLFDSNTALYDGGAVGNYYSTTIANGVTFSNNHAQTGTVDTQAIGGGAISLGAESKTSLSNSTFTGNVSGYDGGAIGTRHSLSANNSGSKLTILNSIFKGNKATGIVSSTQGVGSSLANVAGGNGGAIANHLYESFDGDVSGVKISDSQFIENTAASHGGAIYNGGNTDVVGGVASMVISNTTFSKNTAVKRGGAIYNGGNMVVGGTFEGNHAGSYGGAIFNVGDLTISEGSKFVGNSTDYVGGAIAVAVNQNASLDIGENVLFESNTALYDGGALGNYYSTTVAQGVKFVNNKAQTGTNDSQAIGGGAISLGAESKTLLSKSTFTGNVSGYDGGAIGTRHSLSADNSGSKLTINDSIFDGNKALGTVSSTQGIGSSLVNVAGGNGGAIANHLYKGFNGEDGVQISGSSFINNTAAGYGGAIYNGGSIDASGNKANIVIANSTFESNSATLGGAIYNASQMTLDATNGEILFTGNTDATGVNDIYLAENSETNIKGSNNVTFGGGIAGAFSAVINNIGNLILAAGSVNDKFSGTFNQSAGTTTVATSFFGGVSKVLGGKLLLNDGAKIVANSTVDLSGATVEATGNVVIDGILSASSGKFDLNNGNLTITGDQSSYEGDFVQTGADSVTEIANGTFFGGTNTINGGKFVVKSDAILASDITMAADTELDLDGRTVILDNTGKIIVNDTFGIIGSTVLENVAVDTTNGVNGDIVLGDDSSLIGTTVDVNSNSSLTIATDSNVAGVDTLNVKNNATLVIKPTEDSSLSLNTDIEGDGSVEITSTDSNIYINSDNSGFTGTYNQDSGAVKLTNGATFFGGSNTVEGDAKLLLEDGSLLASDVNIVGDDTTAVQDLASIEFSNSINGITQSQITTGDFVHDSKNGTSNVFVQNATVILVNNSVIKDLDVATNSLVLNTNTSANEGVRFLGLSNGSGVDGDVTLNDGTGLAYGDGAYIKDDSQLKMTNADLIFANDSTNIDYNPVITGSGSITMVGDSTTSISSALNDAININVDSGELNLTNAETSGLGDINIDSTAVEKAVLNVAAKSISIGELNVVGENAQAHFTGLVNGTDVLVNKGTLGLYGDSTLNALVLGSTLSTLDNVNINTVEAGTFTLNEDSSYFFDANPRTGITDKIEVGTFINNVDSNTGELAKLIISGIAFTESPIDRNVTFDISNILTATSGSSTDGVVQMQSGGVVANTAMGRYLITSSGSANSLNASLMALNPQMYRGQVATIASWQNQLVVNNMLFDHMQVVTRQLMDEEKTANRYAAAYPQFAPYQYSAKDGNLWYKAYGVFEKLSMTRGLNVGNNAYGSLIGADFPLVNLKNGWKLLPTAYVGYNGGHQHFNGVSMYQNGAQLGVMGTAYKGDFLTSLLAYGGGYGNDMTVRGQYGNGSDNTGNWFAGVASKTAYNFHLTKSLIFQPTALVSYNAFGSQNWGSNFGAMSMSTGMLNGINAAPGFNLIWQKKSFSLYATAQMVYNVMGGVDGQAGNIDSGYVRMKHSYFEYGIGAMKQLKDRFSGYFQITIRNGGRTGIGFQGGLSWKIGKE